MCTRCRCVHDGGSVCTIDRMTEATEASAKVDRSPIGYLSPSHNTNGPMVIKHFRINEDEWNDAQTRADSEKTTVSEVIRNHLSVYGAKNRVRRLVERKNAWMDSARTRAERDDITLDELVTGWLKDYASGKMPTAPLGQRSAKRLRSALESLEAVIEDSSK